MGVAAEGAVVVAVCDGVGVALGATAAADVGVGAAGVGVGVAAEGAVVVAVCDGVGVALGATAAADVGVGAGLASGCVQPADNTNTDKAANMEPKPTARMP